MNTASRNRAQPLQEPYLAALRDEQVSVSLYLVSGIKLQGTIIAFDHHTLLVSGGPLKQVVYKHAISTIVPARPVSLMAAPTA